MGFKSWVKKKAKKAAKGVAKEANAEIQKKL